MHNLRITILILILVIPIQLLAQSNSGLEEFEIVRQDERITLYERWTPFPGTTTSARQVKGVFEVATSLADMYSAINNEQKIKAWQENILEYKFIPKTDSTWIIYSLTEVPWPLSNQDYLLSYSLLEKNQKKIIVSFAHSTNVELAPIRKDADRTPTVGTWMLEKISDQKTKVTYTVTSMPVSYPRFITDRIVRNNLMSTINKLIVVAEKK
jgi:hypothetical protein